MVTIERIYQFMWQNKANGGNIYKHLRLRHRLMVSKEK